LRKIEIRECGFAPVRKINLLAQIPIAPTTGAQTLKAAASRRLRLHLAHRGAD
jgi:hypothetical protein